MVIQSQKNCILQKKTKKRETKREAATAKEMEGKIADQLEQKKSEA